MFAAARARVRARMFVGVVLATCARSRHANHLDERKAHNRRTRDRRSKNDDCRVRNTKSRAQN